MSGNPFDDLDGLDDDDDADEAESGETSNDRAETAGSPPGQPSASADEVSAAPASGPSTASDASGGDVSESTTEPSSRSDGPAFPYDDVKQRPLYAREEAWNAFEDALELDVERTLREYDVRDATGRELHDAALRVAAEHPEAIAEQLLELRDIDVNR